MPEITLCVQRQGLYRALFFALDRNDDGRLSLSEIGVFGLHLYGAARWDEAAALTLIEQNDSSGWDGSGIGACITTGGLLQRIGA
eukprot:SAG11_NODE_1800_length_4243_cov_4.590734_7_plen_85_part_00